MELTGKCKEEFGDYLNQQKYMVVINQPSQRHPDIIYLSAVFNKLPEATKYGVYVDYFDSVGIKIGIDFTHENFRFDRYWYNILTSYTDITNVFRTRQKARRKAIKQANRIRNSAFA